MTGATPSDDHVRNRCVRSRVATARTKAEQVQRRSMERLELESQRRGWVRMLVNAYEADRNRGGGLLVWVMTMLPHGGRRWVVVLPGALFFATIVRLLTLATVVYFAPKLGRVDDLYGGLGIAIVILLFLYLVARAFVGGRS